MSCFAPSAMKGGKAFLRKAIRHQGPSPKTSIARIVQDDRNLKSRASAILDFKCLGNAAIILAGIELMRAFVKENLA
ncbi:hypothetical protein RI103_39355 (plasmid) [Paraburkholderia sp. FT54]|jgi:transposase-like protein|uniref:hypothetical protein n=1 Tax=Paraburkholderia sp. FT54 TaxID=3074437 RepID=UPI0028772C26|nr:hypothetical protein [Paraburkholderia sp. FT54]WNC95332.1 hypothetical protein RI103_39355 [Paraburkholderia sp. FT54]